MKPSPEPGDLHLTPHPQVPGGSERRAVLEELDRILASSTFRSASRCKQFLSYVVQHQLDGHPEALKERTIGTEVFLREPGYATGDDPVVRVQAGEVRRRLEHYYQTTPETETVRIELPVGSYSPTFHWSNQPTAATAQAGSPVHHSAETAKPRNVWLSPRFWILVVLSLLLAGGAVVFRLRAIQAERERSAIGQFWAPVFSSQQPVLICLAKSVVYRPSQEVYKRYQRTHPGSFGTEVERDNNPLPLASNEPLTWDDLYTASDFGVALGDAYAAINLSGFLGRLGKPLQVRIGSSYSFEDLRNSPAVVVGAFNNRWTMQLTSNMSFVFSEESGDFSIREATPGNRVWRMHQDQHGGIAEDYAIVSRQLNSRTGQFTVIAAGITSAGTQAAAEFVSTPHDLEQGLHNAPDGWQRRNVEFVLETTVIDSVAGPPRVVAASWGGANN